MNNLEQIPGEKKDELTPEQVRNNAIEAINRAIADIEEISKDKPHWPQLKEKLLKTVNETFERINVQNIYDSMNDM